MRAIAGRWQSVVNSESSRSSRGSSTVSLPSDIERRTTSPVHGTAAVPAATTALDTTCTNAHHTGARPTSPESVASGASQAVPVAVPSTSAGSRPRPMRPATAQSSCGRT